MCLVPLAAPATPATTEPRGAFEASSRRDSSSLRSASKKNLVTVQLSAVSYQLSAVLDRFHRSGRKLMADG
jgi:hypothetical protein